LYNKKEFCTKVKNEKNFDGGNLTGKSVRKWACAVALADGTGVETKNCGLISTAI
jgi:hypothetical protein